MGPEFRRNLQSVGQITAPRCVLVHTQQKLRQRHLLARLVKRDEKATSIQHKVNKNCTKTNRVNPASFPKGTLLKHADLGKIQDTKEADF